MQTVIYGQDVPYRERRTKAPPLLTKTVEIVRYRELIRNLVTRDLKVRYRNSIFGFAWSLLNPLFMMGLLSVVFSLVFGKVEVENFPAFLIVGLIPWNFCTTSLSRVVSCLIDNSHLIKKVYFPREVLPISVVMANLVHLALAIPVLLFILTVLGVHLTWKAFLFPPLILIQVLLIMGLAFVISAVNVFYRDMGVALDVLIQGWFFATPIFYHHHILPLWLQKPAMANPLAAIITSYRDVLIYDRWPDLNFTLGALFSSSLVFLLGYVLFNRLSSRFAEEL